MIDCILRIPLSPAKPAPVTKILGKLAERTLLVAPYRRLARFGCRAVIYFPLEDRTDFAEQRRIDDVPFPMTAMSGRFCMLVESESGRELCSFAPTCPAESIWSAVGFVMGCGIGIREDFEYRGAASIIVRP